MSLKAFEKRFMLKLSLLEALGRSSISLMLQVSRVSLLFFSLVSSGDESLGKFFIFEAINLVLGSIIIQCLYFHFSLPLSKLI
jgi:hypothetical protein